MDSIAVAYLDFYNNEMLKRDNGVLYVVRRSGGVDTVRRLLNEQDARENGVADFERVKMNETTEMFYNSVFGATTSVEDERQTVETNEDIMDQTQPETSFPVPDSEVQVRAGEMKRTETNPKRTRRKRSIFWRLEQARKSARKKSLPGKNSK